MTIQAELWIPNDIYVNLREPLPPDPHPIPVSIDVVIFITNTGQEEEILMAMDKCEISTWSVEHSSTGTVVATEPIENRCDMTVYTIRLKPNETRRYATTISINGRRLNKDESYNVKFTYFGQTASDRFRLLALK